MFSVSQYDVLQSLKKFRRLAKQDLITGAHTPDPSFWTVQAEARRSAYRQLMIWIENEGVEGAYEHAVITYSELPLVLPENKQPVILGTEQAHEMFFTVLGLSSQVIARLRNGRRRRRRGNDTAAINLTSHQNELIE